jgi:N-sulfoglucosamine sulfohydrolase
MNRRPSLLLSIALTPIIALAWSCECNADDAKNSRPNVLWITCEDTSPNLGCYGDDYAVTPNLDRLATEGIRYTRAFATAGVCAPSRSSLITGMYASSLGTQYMRCDGRIPPDVRCFTAYLRDAGYYCTNNAKTDYNFQAPRATWDESSKQAHWRNRPQGKPFFSVFNLDSTHEGKIRLPHEQFQRLTAKLSDRERHDPAKTPLPPYHPDTPEVRRDWARYYDLIKVVDSQVGELLRQLADDGLADETIVFFFSDHGAGMPRSKRWLYDSSTRVPLLVRMPDQLQQPDFPKPGCTDGRLVSLIDLAPTVLNLAGVAAVKHMQGLVFLGGRSVVQREYVYGHRDRMDERYDMIRSVRDRRFKYIRNFRPDLPYFREQRLEYAYEMPTMKLWQKMADEGRLRGLAATFMAAEKPAEELYDVEADPWEINNLANSPEHQLDLQRMRNQLRGWMARSIDLGVLPETDLRSRFGDTAPYSAVRQAHELSWAPYREILETAELASHHKQGDDQSLTNRLTDDDPAIRFWAAVGLGSVKGQDAKRVKVLLDAADNDQENAIVRAAAAESLCRCGEFEAAVPVLANLMESDNEWVRLYAANVLDRHGDKARRAIDALRRGVGDSNDYVRRVCRHAVQTIRDIDSTQKR